MKINRVVIHELSKIQGKTGAKLSKSLSLLDITQEIVITLVTELNKRYRKRNEKQGIFDDENPSTFHDMFRVFEKEQNDKNFIEFSIKSAENLKDMIQGITPAKGGYLVFAHYEDYREYCAIFFVRDTTSIAFKRNKSVENYDLNKVEHIDFEKLAMACRINLESFHDDQSKYLSFIHTKSDELSDYFVNWISSKDTITSEEDTTQLLKALRAIPLPKQPQGTPPLDRDATLRNAYNHIKASPTRTVNIVEMSKTLFNDEDYLADYVFQNYPEVPTEFKAHSTTLNRFVKVFAKADQIELIFHPDAFRKQLVRFDEKDSTQLIIRSEELVKQVRESVKN